MLLSDKFYCSFVLAPCEICVVPFGHWKIAPDRNDISRANIRSTVVSLTHACASLRSFKHGYLSLQKYSLQQYFITKPPLPTLLHNRRFYPQSTSWLHQLVDTPRHNRICSSRCFFKCGGWAARPAAGHKIADGKRKRHVTWHVFFLTGSYLSSQAASSQVLSTYKGLTTVFGMGTGGSP